MSAVVAQRRIVHSYFALLFFFVALFFQITVRAQTETTTGIRGVVKTESNGELIAGARILVKNGASEVRRETLSDGEGRFAIYGLPPGVAYQVMVEAAGFRPSVTDNARLASGDVLTLNIALELSVIQESV